MDVLTDILDGLEMRGSLYFCTAFADPWSIDVPADADVCRFHVVVQGHCRVTVPESGDVRELTKGDLVLVPHGNAHWLQSQADRPPVPLGEVMERGEMSDDGCLGWGGDGAVTRMVCGFFDFDKETAHPLLDALPSLLHVEATSSYDFGWIENVTRFISQEAGSGRPGSEAIARRLSEILFIQVVRHQAAASSASLPLLSAIVDSHLGRALRAMHAAPGEGWTVEALAREALLSRTAFAERFSALVGLPPIEYLTRLRMRHARTLLRGDDGVAAVGEAVGYRSEAAFHRAFKRAHGLGPGAYRRRSRLGPASSGVR